MIRIKGHESKLTEFGIFLIQFIEDMQAGYLKHDPRYHEILLKEIKKIQKSESVRWKFFSSSDSVIQKAAAEIKGVELKIAGSGESLEKLLNNEAHIAGYYVSDQKSSKAIYQRL